MIYTTFDKISGTSPDTFKCSLDGIRLLREVDTEKIRTGLNITDNSQKISFIDIARVTSVHTVLRIFTAHPEHELLYYQLKVAIANNYLKWIYQTTKWNPPSFVQDSIDRVNDFVAGRCTKKELSELHAEIRCKLTDALHKLPCDPITQMYHLLYLHKPYDVALQLLREDCFTIHYAKFGRSAEELDRK